MSERTIKIHGDGYVEISYEFAPGEVEALNAKFAQIDRDNRNNILNHKLDFSYYNVMTRTEAEKFRQKQKQQELRRNGKK